MLSSHFGEDFGHLGLHFGLLGYGLASTRLSHARVEAMVIITELGVDTALSRRLTRLLVKNTVASLEVIVAVAAAQSEAFNLASCSTCDGRGRRGTRCTGH